MAMLQNTDLEVTTDGLDNLATVLASCDVDFTEFEVNAMNKLGLRYTVGCQVLNKDRNYEDPVIRFHDQDLPLTPTAATLSEHVVFRTDAVMSDLHQRLFGKDQLLAEFTLTDTETGAEEVRRSNLLAVNLVP
jgi:hypothetical protein